MEPYTLSLGVVLVLSTIIFALKYARKLAIPNLPPGPKPWPIIGNIHQLGDRPHRSVAELSKKYGPIMSLKLGTLKTIVISSADVAKQMFTNHDLAFSGRKFPDAARASDHHKHSVVLLKLVEDNAMSLDDVRHMLMDLFVAGTDTTSSTLEWAMTELLCNPEKMSKAQDEIDRVVGNKNKSIQETDISKLPYIQAVVKETFRLHPPAPFLVPHKAEKDVNLSGFFIPEDAQVWVNVWAIGRDPSVWRDPLTFSPERFLENDIDFKGTDFELIPFGAGRRICPGMPLAHRMLHHMLAALLHSFNWKHAHGLSPVDIDVEEKFGITLQKVQPLEAIPFAR